MNFVEELMKIGQFEPSEEDLEDQLLKLGIVATKLGLYKAKAALEDVMRKRSELWVAAYSKANSNPVQYADDMLEEFDKRFNSVPTN